MKCPRCNTKQCELRGGKIVPANVDQCVFCGFKMQDNSYVNHALEKMQQCVVQFKKNGDKSFLEKAGIFFNAALAEVEERGLR